MAELAWSPLAVGFGAQVHGMDIAAPLVVATATALRALWLERGLLLFRGLEIDDAAQALRADRDFVHTGTTETRL